jgi:hypothetical protein
MNRVPSVITPNGGGFANRAVRTSVVVEVSDIERPNERIDNTRSDVKDRSAIARTRPTYLTTTSESVDVSEQDLEVPGEEETLSEDRDVSLISRVNACASLDVLSELMLRSVVVRENPGVCETESELAEASSVVRARRSALLTESARLDLSVIARTNAMTLLTESLELLVSEVDLPDPNALETESLKADASLIDLEKRTTRLTASVLEEVSAVALANACAARVTESLDSEVSDTDLGRPST